MGIALVMQVLRVPMGVSNALLVRLLGIGVLIAIHWILFFLSAQVSTVSISLAGFATTSLWTALLEPLIRRQKIQKVEILIGLIILLGLYLIFLFEFDHLLGLSLGVASAIGAAVFASLNVQVAQKGHPPLVISFYEMVGACAASGLVMPFLAHWTDKPLWPNATDWAWILVLAWVCTVFAHTVSVSLMRRFSAFAINLVVNLEPVYGIILAVIFLGQKEKMSLGFYAGAALILCTVLLYPWLSRQLGTSEKTNQQSLS
jgi:drug/metabolite transporter (DMT)-like permease